MIRNTRCNVQQQCIMYNAHFLLLRDVSCYFFAIGNLNIFGVVFFTIFAVRQTKCHFITIIEDLSDFFSLLKIQKKLNKNFKNCKTKFNLNLMSTFYEHDWKFSKEKTLVKYLVHEQKQQIFCKWFTIFLSIFYYIWLAMNRRNKAKWKFGFKPVILKQNIVITCMYR